MSTTIRDSRRERGLTIYDLAERLEVTAGAVSQMERSERDESIRLSTLKRALHAMGKDLDTLRAVDAPMETRHLLTARQAAADMRRALDRMNEDEALRISIQALDHFQQATTKSEVQDFLRAPSTTGDDRWDTLLATIVAWGANQRGLSSPRWTRKAPLKSEWIPATPGEPNSRYLSMIRESAVPGFLERNILMRERDLQVA